MAEFDFQKFIARGMPVDCRSIALIDWSSSNTQLLAAQNNKTSAKTDGQSVIGGGYNANTRARGPFKTLIGLRKGPPQGDLPLSRLVFS
jgi:hypothetical protein